MAEHSLSPCEDPGSIPGPAIKGIKLFSEEGFKYLDSIIAEADKDVLKTNSQGLQKMMFDRHD